MKAIIVEDEISSQQYLQYLLKENFSNISVAAVADNVPEAVKAIQEHDPELIFLDVDIRLGTGFDVLDALADIRAEIIFTTAFDQYAIDAFSYHAADYLLKPLEDDRVIDTVHRCISRAELRQTRVQLTQLLQHFRQPLHKETIGIHSREGIEFVETAGIIYAEAKGNYTILKLHNGKKITVSKKLKEMEDSLCGPAFFRIHHSYIINARCISKYYRGRGGYVVLTDNTSLPVSIGRKDDFLQRFG